jgi:hypothetical protein
LYDFDQEPSSPRHSGTGYTYYHVSPTLGEDAVATVRQHLMADYPEKCVLVIHDRGEQHQGAPVEAILRDGGGRLVLKPQPASSPELNPQERIWEWWRRVVTPNHWFGTLGEPIEAMRNVFRCLAGIKDQVGRRCSLKTSKFLVASR